MSARSAVEFASADEWIAQPGGRALRDLFEWAMTPGWREPTSPEDLIGLFASFSKDGDCRGASRQEASTLWDFWEAYQGVLDMHAELMTAERNESRA